MGEGLDVDIAHPARTAPNTAAGSISVRNASVLTNMPTTSSSSASPRPATGVPITTSRSWPIRASSTANAVWHHHEHRRIVLFRNVGQRAVHARTHRELDTSAARRSAGAPRAIQRQASSPAVRREPVEPVRLLAGEHRRRVVGIAEDAALPQREVRVLHGQRLPAGGRPATRAA